MIKNLLRLIEKKHPSSNDCIESLIFLSQRDESYSTILKYDAIGILTQNKTQDNDVQIQQIFENMNQVWKNARKSVASK